MRPSVRLPRGEGVHSRGVALPCRDGFYFYGVWSREDDLPLGELEGEGMTLMRWRRDRSMAEKLKSSITSNKKDNIIH